MIILVGGEKGGTGKTTFAVNFAVMRMNETQDVLLVDAEPAQPNASKWCVLRDSNEIKPRISSVQKSGKNLHYDLQDLSKKYKDIVIDTGGQDTVELRGSMVVADVAVSPIRPEGFDLWTLGNLDKMVGEVKIMNPKLKFYVFLNQGQTNPKVEHVQEAIQYFNEAGFENIRLAQTVVRQRIAFCKVAREGCSVIELGIDPKAEAEITALYNEVIHG
jgi:chromosome partitioning protein